MIKTVYILSHRQLSLLLGVIILCLSALSVVVISNPVSAAAHDEPDTSGVYTQMQLARQNTFYAYANANEVAHFKVMDGYYNPGWSGNNNGDKDRCAYVFIYNSSGTIVSNGGSKLSTCDGNNVPKATTHVYAPNDTGTPQLYRIVFTPERVIDEGLDPVKTVTKDCDPRDSSKCDTQAYQWKAWVNNNTGDNDTGLQIGRVYVDQASGLHTLQVTQSGARGTGTSETTLQYHATNVSFFYARKDGYRYKVTYKEFQGIWSDFYSGVFGIFNTSSDVLAYRSANKNDGAYNVFYYQDAATAYNNAYIFTDCRETSLMGCTGINTTLGLTAVTQYPIASNSGGENGNPIVDVGNYTSSSNTTGFRFTDFSTSGGQFSGGTVTVPYRRMQSGYIHIWIEDVTDSNAVICDWTSDIINSGTGVGSKSYDPTCINGISTSHVLRVNAQAIHLGEMHFINTDVETRGGITVEGNGLYASSPRNAFGVIYNDPFSTASSAMCGSLVDNYINSDSYVSSNTGTGKDRQPIDSNIATGVHGWKVNSHCDNTTSAGSNTSPWGNNRNIEDWVYSYLDPSPRSFTIGGPTYALTPTVTVSPSAQVVSGQNPTFSYSVSNDTSSSNDTDWSIRTVVVPPGVSLPPDYRDGFDGTGRTCASYYAASPRGAVTCNDALASGSGKFPGTSIADETVPNTYAVGTLICRSLTVNSYDQTSAPNARTSALTCVMVTALPYVSVIGGSIWSGGSTDATTGYANSSGKIEGSSTMSAGFGSFGEYDLFATNSINFFGSSARPGPALASSGAVDGAGLTFGSATSLGSFSTSHKITDLVARLCNGVLGNNTTNFAGNNDEVIHVGEHLVKCFDTLNIKKNITYDPAGATSFGQLPSLIVVANRIEIDGSVTQIAGNFYAAEAFVTCAEGPRSSADNTNSGKTARITTSGSCTNKLTINGSVTVAGQVVNSLVLNRSYGGTKTGEAAETIRMRPEVFLTPYENSLLLTTVSETELPARY